MRKRINKLLSLIILVTTLFNCSVNVFANEDINHETIQSDNIVEDNLVPEVDVSAPINEEEEKTFSYITNSVCESIPFEVDKINNTNYQQIDGYSVGEIQNVSELESIPAVISNIEENTNPNYAYALSANTEYSGNITQEGEIRWYAFDISGKTKISVLIRTVEALDADIFLFRLDTSTMQLKSTNLSARSTGAEEYFSSVLDSGIYYFAILGATGNGMYILDFFQNANYVDNEINDSIDTAQLVGSDNGFSGGSVTGMIDTMRDVDCYKINVVSTPVLVRLTYVASNSHSLIWVDNDSAPERLAYEDGRYILAPGTHYFAMYDPNGNFFTSGGEYTITFELITGSLTNDMKAKMFNYYPQWNAIVQYYPDRSKYFINGTNISINCSFSGNIGSNVNNPLYRRWSISLSNGYGLVYNLKRAENDYHSVLKDQRITRVYIMEIGTENGDISFGSHSTQQGTVNSVQKVTYAVVAIDAMTGKVVDIILPDPNPYD